MRLLSFAYEPGGPHHVGLLVSGERVLDIGTSALHSGSPLPFDASDMVSLIAAGAPGLDAVRRLAASVADADGAPLDSLQVLAPIARPRKNVFCLGLNFEEHFLQNERIRPSGQSMPTVPLFFSKATTSVTGPYDAIPYDARMTEQVDWEVELAVVIGTGGKNIAEERAMQHLFGYTVMNDVSARDIQFRHGGQFFKGKSLDGYCPMGPWIVTVDELGDPNHLRIGTRVNGVTKQDASTEQFHFKIPRVLGDLSLGLTLEPGDVVSMGTPGGCGYAQTPPEYLKPGDLLETECEGIGVLQNRIGQDGSADGRAPAHSGHTLATPA